MLFSGRLGKDEDSRSTQDFVDDIGLALLRVAELVDGPLVYSCMFLECASKQHGLEVPYSGA
jgi:hypothetical protein